MELIFNDDYRRRQCEIYLREQQGSRIVMIGYDGEHLVQQTLSESEIPEFEIKPLLVIPLSMKSALIKAFTEQGAEMNIKTENENLLKGKLEATEIHLSDMREFAKKLLDNKLTI